MAGKNPFPRHENPGENSLFFSHHSQRNRVIAVRTFYFDEILIPPWIFSTKLHGVKIRKEIVVKEAAESSGIIAI
jgi:hypothetical protein